MTTEDDALMEEVARREEAIHRRFVCVCVFVSVAVAVVIIGTLSGLF